MKKWLDRASLLVDRNLSLGEVIARLAAVHGDRVLATQPDGSQWTYETAAAAVDRHASAIARRAHRGERVVVAMPNSYEMFLVCLATARAGALPVPVNPQMTAAEVDHVIADSGAALVVRSGDDLEGDAGDAEPVSPPRARAAATDVAAVFYSSGTTGTPKGARLTHRALLGQSRTAVAWPAGLRRDEAVAGLPVAHIMGFTVLLGLAVAGIPLHFLPRFRPTDALDAIESRRATVFVGVPAMYRMMLEAGAEGRDLRSVRVWASGADVMPADLARRFQRMGASATLPLLGSVGEAVFVEGYGMVEVGGGVAAKFSPPGGAGPFANVLGLPLPGYRFKVVDEAGRDVALGQVGELLVKGPGVLEGYHGDAAATDEVLTGDGWLRTGDLVRKGPLGMVGFAGRGKDVVKSGGYSVYALEVQRVLESHPAVAEAAVVGVADERLGEQVAAAVRLQPGAAATEDDLRAWCTERLASYKVPATVRLVDDLPRTGTDKVRRDEVRRLLE